MKILVLTLGFPPSTGGVQNLVYNYTKNTKNSVKVLKIGKEEGHKKFDERLDFPVKRYSKSILTPFLLILNIFFLSWKYDRLYCTKFELGIFGLFTPLDVVIHGHGKDLLEPVYGMLNGFKRVLGVYAFRKAKKGIANSRFTACLMKATGSNTPVDIVHPGVQTFQKQSLTPQTPIYSDSKFSLLTVSRLGQRKGHKLVIEAISNLDDIEYVIAGDGPERQDIASLVEQEGLEERVSMEGYVAQDDLHRYYQGCDAFIMPSQVIMETGSVEGFGIVFLEANYFGKPAIGTKTGGIPSAIKHEETGLLCWPDADSVKNAIVRLKQNPDLYGHMQKEGKKWAREHAWTEVAERMDKAIYSI